MNGFTTALRAASLLLLTALLAACAEPEVSGTVVVQTEEAAPQDVNRTAQVLLLRFEDVLPMSSVVTFVANGNTVTFTFRGAIPGEQALRRLASTRGVLRIGPADRQGETWASDTDVEDAQLTRSSEGPFIAVRLNAEGGRRLLDATSRSVGRTLLTSWDGQVILSATIAGPFGQAFQFNAPSSEEDARILAIALRHGRLPVAVKFFEYHDARPKG